jgi:predicted PurR-regulated permease PerM
VFIPAIGTYIGGAIPILFTLAIQATVAALIVLAYVLIYQQIENYWLSPKISSKSMSINGAVAFGGALFGGAIAGPMGAFISLPVAALITSLVSNFAPHHKVVYTFSYDEHETALHQEIEKQDTKKAQDD